ncbi:MAG: HAD family phosphatase [Lachnospiraceae bacterium]|nr:HAD family phosphatase [Lachnospiraceae bacterium]
MSTYDVIVLDLDGTLTNSKKVITPKTKEALLKVQCAGKKVVLASGRPTGGVVYLADELRLDEFGGYILSFNGGHIINYAEGKVIYNKIVPRELTEAIYRETLKAGLGIITYADSEIVAGTEVDAYMELEHKITRMPIRKVDNFVETIDFPVNKYLLTGEPDKVLAAQEHMREVFGDKMNIFRSEPYFLEMMPQSIDKAYSLGILLEYLKTDRTHMICCGDGFNDRSMIQMAGLGVAMANAQDEIKEIADYITSSNDEDGVAEVVYKFMLT